MSAPPEGLLLIDKPTGPTSHDIVQHLRRLLGQSRVGHAGTLDPGASGLLPVVLGRATRLVRFLPREPKLYEGRLRLGITTTTDDIHGEIVERSLVDPPSPEAVRAAVLQLQGRYPQVPPVVSARKVGGKRSYRLARAGRPVQAEATEIEVFRFEVEPTSEPADWEFVAEVTAGSYIRALARDLGRLLGCGGTLVALRRTRIGPLDVCDAAPLAGTSGDEVKKALLAAVVPLDTMPLTLLRLRLEDDVQARRFAAGLPAPAGDRPEASGARCVLDARGRLLGVGELEAGYVLPRVVISLRLPGD